MALQVYTPELGQEKPEAQIEAQLSHYGKHYFIKTPLDLKGQGITFLGELTSEQLVPQAQHKIGWKEYKVTTRAFRKLCEKYAVSKEQLLD